MSEEGFITMDIRQESLKMHGEWKGKIEVISKVPVASKHDLSLAYTPSRRAVPRNTEGCQPFIYLHKALESRRCGNRRHSGARPGGHWPRGRYAGNGGQVCVV